jgi:hypothetical protein
MKKLIVPVVCVLVGCAAGAGMPAIAAQTFGAPRPGAPTYEAFCVEYSRGFDLNELVATHGRNGFHLTSATLAANTYACFERAVQ